MKYDVFISYRRKGGKELARIIKAELEKRRLKVFLDFDELKDCRFGNEIKSAIESSSVFLMILSENSLDRCANENDWVKEEIMYADELHRHIVPVDVDKRFGNIPENIPQEIKNIIRIASMVAN